MITTALLTFGLVLLFFGAEVLIKGAVSVARRLGVSPLVIGLTIVAFGTIAPELTVSILTALSGQGDIAAANAVGSNIFNIAFILGIAALICPIHINQQLVRREIPFMIGVTLLGVWMLASKSLTRWEGATLTFTMFLYIGGVFYFNKPSEDQIETTTKNSLSDRPQLKIALAIFGIIGGIIMLVLGSEALISGAVRLARSAGISETVIGLTIISIGTSLPELTTSIVAAWRRQPDISIGNLIGSNIFNLKNAVENDL